MSYSMRGMFSGSWICRSAMCERSWQVRRNAAAHIFAIFKEAGARRERRENGTHVVDYEHRVRFDGEVKDNARKTRADENCSPGASA